MRFSPAIILSLISMILTAMAGPAYSADKRQKAERLVAEATQTLDFFTNGRDFSGLWNTVDDAKAMVIIPDSYRAGFVFGGSAGNAVMVARNDDGSWSGPTFMTIGSFSFGFQAGGEVSELILLAMTNRGKERLLSSSVKLGGDVTIAAGPVGIGAKAKTADILAFSRSRGLYGGLSLEGSILKTRRSWNAAYYGATVTPTDVVFRGVQDNPASLPLRDAAFRLANRSGKGLNQEQAPSVSTVNDPTHLQNTNVRFGSPSLTTQRQSQPLTPIEETPVQYDDDAVYGAPLTEPVRDPGQQR